MKKLAGSKGSILLARSRTLSGESFESPCDGTVIRNELEGSSDGEVEGSGGVSRCGVEGASVFEANWADGEVNAEPESEGQFGVEIRQGGCCFLEGSGVKENDAMDGAGNLADVFRIGIPEGLATAFDSVDAGA